MIDDEVGHVFAEEEVGFVGLGESFEARGEVYCVADDGELHLFVGAEVADNGLALVDSDSD